MTVDEANVKYAAAHHYGVPGRLPRRPLWPEADQWPQHWWDDMTDELENGLERLVSILVQRIR